MSDLRASDAERDAVAERLREHAGHGRLSVEELGDRVERALGARTRGELTALEADLPRPRPPDRSLRAHATVYVAVNLGFVVLWALCGFGEFWPIWPALGWGIGLASHARGGHACSARSRSRALTAPSRTIDHLPSGS